MRYAIKFGYNGRNFYGFSRQPNLRTIEGEIIKRLNECKIEFNNFIVASRTDRGVCAIGNVLSLSTNFDGDLLSVLNSKLEDIYFYSIINVDEKFNPKKALERRYKYFLFNDNLNIHAMKEASKLFLGEHDFRNFTKVKNKNTIRKINDISIIEKEKFIFIDVKAKSFLWNMIRRIVSTLVKIGENKIDIDDLISVIDCRKKYYFGLANAEQLILVDVKYDFEFPVDRNKIKKLRDKLIHCREIEKTYSTLITEIYEKISI